MDRDMITARLEMHPKSKVSSISTATGYISKRTTDEKYVDILYDGFSESISTLKMSSDNDKVLTSVGEAKEVNINYSFEWEYDKEVFIYAVRTNGDSTNMVVTSGYIRSIFELPDQRAQMQIGPLDFNIRYEDYYGWHIDCVTKENVHIVDSFVPESRVFGDKGGSTEVLRIGFSGGTEEIITESGIKRYEVANRIRYCNKSQD